MGHKYAYLRIRRSTDDLYLVPYPPPNFWARAEIYIDKYIGVCVCVCVYVCVFEHLIN